MERAVRLLLFTVAEQTVAALIRNSMDLMWYLTFERQWISLIVQRLFCWMSHILIIFHAIICSLSI